MSELGYGGEVQPIEELLDLPGRMGVTSRDLPPVQQLAVLVEADPGRLQEVALDRRRDESVQVVEVRGGRADPVPEDREKGGVLQDGVARLHPPECRYVFEETDLQANGRDPRVDQVPVGLRELPGHQEVPTDEDAHHQQEACDGETELVAEAQ